ncbi:translationally-controlled tumor protein [Multifurca ochricompacta]|uniref:Translationally-controlled tumor protein homolog n=1 Tax=Multifurca ochricompacta TaxID=376703 RepID=A0AAD4MBL5_9AGAM|nr:translationally-controlled tumor protein [Multifurca ochricompacta]
MYEDIITRRDVFRCISHVLLISFQSKVVDDIVYEVNCQLITVKKGADVDIGLCKSLAEEQEDALEDGSETVNNVAHSFRLERTSFDKKSFLTYLKGYMKRVKEKLPAERVADFEKNAQTFAKKIVTNFKDYEFYTGGSMDPDGMDGITREYSPPFVELSSPNNLYLAAYFTFWKDGLKEVKL